MSALVAEKSEAPIEEVTKSLESSTVQDPTALTADVKIINLESHVAEDVYFTDPSFKMSVYSFLLIIARVHISSP